MRVQADQHSCSQLYSNPTEFVKTRRRGFLGGLMTKASVCASLMVEAPSRPAKMLLSEAQKAVKAAGVRAWKGGVSVTPRVKKSWVKSCPCMVWCARCACEIGLSVKAAPAHPGSQLTGCLMRYQFNSFLCPSTRGGRAKSLSK